ncbi:MAG: hypothetical protein KC910_21000 [Candidatus Eremiobacteraeota bacterium]|nr:hypothetical protein [Candidatus Eremiobacteraeota bacterium]
MSLLIAMFVGAAASLNPGQLGLVRNEADYKAARGAARSGLAYAMTRLEENPNWRGDGNGIVVDTPDMVVVEQDGNVVGLLRDGSGRTAQFRIRFNHQDGGGGGDDLDDPPSEFRFDTPYVSVNNLLGSGPVALPIANGVGYSVNGSADHDVPEHCAALLVEGRVSPQLSVADASNPNPRLQAVRAHLTIESLCGVGDLELEGDISGAVLMSAGDFVTDLTGTDPLSLASVGSDQPTRVRVKNDMVVDGAGENLRTAATAEVLAGGSVKANFNSDHISRALEEAGDAFYQLAWDDVDDPGEGTLPAGVYVFWEADGKVHYYPDNWEDYDARIKANPSDPGTVVNLSGAVSFHEADGKKVFAVTTEVDVTPVGDPSNPVEDLTIIPRSGVAEDASNPSRPPLPYGAPTDYASAAVNYIGINDWNDGSEIHEMLKTLAPVGDFSDPSGNGIHWDQNVMTVYGSGPRAVTYLFSGGNMHTTNSPNGTLLSPQGADRYIIDPAAFDDFVANPGTGRDMETLNLGAATDSLAPQDFEVRFEGADGGPASLATTGNGDIRFGADLSGENASIKAGGQIRIVGVGVDLSADPDAERAGVSLYARDDIFISTLRPHEDDPTLYDYVDVQLKGIVYSWKNITVEVGGEKHAGRKFDLRGAMVAYGGDPSAPPVAGQGNVYLTADSVNLTFDPAYLTSWMPSAPTSVQMTNLSTHEL